MNNDHIELVFGGLYDRISGNETYASRYLGGVLWANEPSRMFVSGNEGFVDSVSDGVKKAWEYIKGMFKKIFDWLFGGSSKKKVETVKTEIKEAQESIKEVRSPPELTVSQAKIILTETAKKPFLKLNYQDRLKQLQEKLSESESGTEEVPKEEAKRIVKEVFELQVASQEIFTKSAEKMKGIRESLDKQLKEVQELKASGGNGEFSESVSRKVSGISLGTGPVLAGMKEVYELVKNVSDASSAEKFLTKSTSCIQAISNNLENVKSAKTDIEYFIKKTEGELQKGQDNKKSKELVDCLKLMLKQVNSVISSINNFIDVISSCAKKVKGCSPL